MSDIFGNKKPVCIEGGEWWFNGRIIQRQNHPLLSKYISFQDKIFDSYVVNTHSTFKEAVKHAINNPVHHPDHYPSDYIGGKKEKQHA